MTTPQPRSEWDDSIDLRKWVDALIRYKFLILGIVVAAVGSAAVLSLEQGLLPNLRAIK